MLGNIHRTKLREELGIDKKLEILLVIALGKPVEDVVIDDVGKDGNIKYWRDENRVHHVPKRNIEDLVINI